MAVDTLGPSLERLCVRHRDPGDLVVKNDAEVACMTASALDRRHRVSILERQWRARLADDDVLDALRQRECGERQAIAGFVTGYAPDAGVRIDRGGSLV
jgi:hypothetical protein